MNDELFLALGRLEGKMDALIQMQHVQQEEIKSLDERVRGLENSKSFLMGGSAVVGAAVSIFINIATRYLSHG
jgi:hypothetical protein